MAPADTPDADGDPTLGDELRALNVEARAAISAELGYQTARARLVGKAAARIAGFGLLAIAALYFVLMALVLGAIVALAPYLGGWGATALVVVALLGIVAGAALGAWSGVRRIRRLLAETKDQP
ncbi:MAG: phage holin family protein [Proteobacteria bacterium]|nr:phage holin family protein [Pseudomonadota bacterium]